MEDKILNSIFIELRKKYHCHTIILYGSRVRGLTTPTSDYDVVGIRKRGPKTRITKKQNGFYWDVFVYSEKNLKKLGEEHFTWKNAAVLYEEKQFGRKLLSRLKKHIKAPYKKKPRYEIVATQVWAQKELDRCRQKDTQALYRRVEFLAALIDHYYFVRQKRFWGPKEGFTWLKKNDPQTFRSIEKALRFPTNLKFLKSAAQRVYKTSFD